MRTEDKQVLDNLVVVKENEYVSWIYMLNVQQYGFSSFRRYQKKVIEKIIAGRDCLIVMATGSGKSSCYQLPPLVIGKSGVVVSPLISLMQDQQTHRLQSDPQLLCKES